MNKTNIIIGILLISVIFMVILGFAYSQTVIKIYITDTYYDINNDKILVINIEHPKYLTLFNENSTYIIPSPTNSNYYFKGKIYDWSKPPEMSHFYGYIQSLNIFYFLGE